MKSRISAVSIAVFLMLTGAAVTNVAEGQDTAANAAARKVRTKITPVYPPLARQLNVSGRVKLEVIVGADGHVVSTRTIGGSPLLVGPASDAVKKRRYEPAAQESTEFAEFNFSDRE
jgi:outer membrane biosynthesis protein TonB